MNHWSAILEVVLFRDEQRQCLSDEQGLKLTKPEKAGVVLGTPTSSSFTSLEEVAVNKHPTRAEKRNERRYKRAVNEAAHMNEVESATPKRKTAARISHTHAGTMTEGIVSREVVASRCERLTDVKAKDGPTA